VSCLTTNRRIEPSSLHPHRRKVSRIVWRSEAPFYVQDLENRAADQGWQEKILPSLDGTRATLDVALEPTTNVVCSVVRPSEMDDDYGFGGIYDGGQPRPGHVERCVWLSPETT
jgi:hypothetical protein